MTKHDITLFGGVEITVYLDDGSKEPKPQTVTVRQFKLKEYPALLPYAENKFELAARATQKPRAFIETLLPASFTELADKVREVNAAGFFDFAAGEQEAGSRLIAQLIQHGLPLEKITELLKAGGTVSSGSFLNVPPPPV